MNDSINYIGTQISYDGRTEWRINGGITERRHLYAGDMRWETVASPCPRTEGELLDMCIAGGFDFERAITYCVITQRNMYHPDLQGLGNCEPLNDDSGNAIVYDTMDEALAAIDEADSGIYVTGNGEAGRPEYWIVDSDAVRMINGRREDLGNYPWPEDGGDCTTPDRDGNQCGDCNQCREWMEAQDNDFLTAAKIEVE